MPNPKPTAAKDFHLGDVLSVTTGKLVSPRHVEGVYDILNFMTGESVFTHQIPRVCKEAKPVLIEQHPFLADITGDDVTVENWQTWLSDLVAKHGETLPIRTMTIDEHEYIDPESELAEKIHPSRIIGLGKA